MKTATAVGFALLAICLVGATDAGAQIPNIAVYYEDIAKEQAVCPGVGILDTLYVVAQNVNTFANAAEYSIEYSPGHGYLIFLADFPAVLNPYTISLGVSPLGLSLAWSLPKNMFVPFIVQRVLVIWECNVCVGMDIIRVRKHPATNFLGVAEFGTGKLIPCVGLTALICATVPTHEKTWGAVKAMYN